MPTIVATFGGSISNSYVTLTNANSFIATTLYSEFFNGLAKTEREILLLTATRSIDGKAWSGGRFFFDQSLKFPRSLVDPYPRGTNPSTFSVEWTNMIKKVEEACSIQAVWEKLRNSGEVDYRLIQSQGIRSISQGGGNTNTSVSFNSYANILHPDVRQLLMEWRGSTKVFRG